MNWIKIKNNTKVNLNDIPTLDIDDLRNEIISLVTIDKMRPIAFFGKDWGRGQVKLFVALADDGQNKPAAASDKEGEIGRASCRERV